jgi:ribose 5-phosphate isomerase B
VKWFAGSDHAGLRLKQVLIAKLKEVGDEVIDVGTHDDQSVDYPDFGAEVGRRVAAEASETTRGLVVCGSGIGISIAANKIAGIRCALVHDSYTAELARQHNDANVIGMGARVIGPGVAEDALLRFRGMPFLGGRHQRRVDLLTALDKPPSQK